MVSTLYRWSLPISTAICVLLLILILTTRQLPDITIVTHEIRLVFASFMDIFLDALPFMLLGILLSTFVENFIPEAFIRRMTPRNSFGGVLFACALGIMFPLCECGMIPFVRRLMKKGMPVYIAVIFILVGPILNPIVFASTYMAFRNSPEMAYSRMGLTFTVALVVGFILTRFLKSSPLRLSANHHPNSLNTASLTEHIHIHDHVHKHEDDHHHHHHHSQDNHHDHSHHDHSHSHGGRLATMLSHGTSELVEMGKYLMMGALLTALIQTFIAKDSLSAIGQGPFVSHLFMMGFAYLLSLCSTTDAFVISTFSTTFSSGSLLAFLVFGPMIDVKSTLMMLSIFKARFVLSLSIIVAVTVLTGSLVFMHLFLT